MNKQLDNLYQQAIGMMPEERYEDLKEIMTFKEFYEQYVVKAEPYLKAKVEEINTIDVLDPSGATEGEIVHLHQRINQLEEELKQHKANAMIEYSGKEIDFKL